MNHFIIREANTNDYVALLELIKEFAQFQKTPEKVTITVEQMKEDKHFFLCLIAETKEGTMVGFATYFPVYFSWSGKAMYVDDLFVKDGFRKNGIGKQLLYEVINLAKENGVKKFAGRYQTGTQMQLIFTKAWVLK